MRIALDATTSVGKKLTGVGVYSSEILSGLAAAHPEAELLCCYRPQRFLRALESSLPANCHRRLLWPGPPRGADLFHGLNQRLPEGRLRRAVSTFHDLFVLSGKYSTPEFRERFAGQSKDAAKRSDLIIAVSAFTANQVTELLGVERSRVRVIHHGVRIPTQLLQPLPYGRGSDGAARVSKRLNTSTILHVGAIQHRKNIIRLIAAFEQTHEPWRLVLAGSLGFGGAEILARIESSPRRASIELPGYVSQAALEGLWAEAAILAFPSLDEGFGLPVLEAMARGIPVLTSDCSALKEVAGDAAMLVDPTNQEQITNSLLSLTRSPELRRDLIDRGLARAARFTWESAAGKTWEVYKELLDGRQIRTAI